MSKINESKLVSGLISKLPQEDLGKIRLFLQSPYHNSNKKLVPFFEAIVRYYPDFSGVGFTEEKIYKRLYPGRKYNLGTMKRLKTDLTSKIEAYLAHEELRQNEQRRKEFTGRGYARRNAYNKFRLASEKVLETIESNSNKSTQDFQFMLNIYHDLFFHPESSKDSSLAERYIISCMNHLDAFYFFSKLTYSIELLTRSRIQDQKYAIKLLQESVDFGKKHIELSGNILFRMYALIILFLKEQKESTFKELKAIFFESYDEVPQEGRLLIVVILINYAIEEYSKGNLPYRNELFELYKLRDQLDLYLANNRISDNAFVNVVITAAACREFVWAEYFINKYRPFIAAEHYEDTLTLCRANLHFYKKEYHETINLLNTVSSKNLYTEIRYRSLSIRAYYEISLEDPSYDDLAEKQIINFDGYLKRHSINEQRRKAFQNFCRVCKALLWRKPKKRINVLIAGMNFLSFRAWLLEKIDDLK